MKITSISCQNYKSFFQSTTIEFAPITILIGRNSSGKSAISRLPVLLAHAFDQGAKSPLDCSFDGLDFGASTLDLIHNRAPHGALAFGITLDDPVDGEINLNVRIQYFDEYKLQQITEWTLSTRSKTFSLRWVGDDPRATHSQFLLGDSGTPIRLRFRGLVPIGWDQLLNQSDNQFGTFVRIWELVTRISESMRTIQYLGPFRKAPERYYRYATTIEDRIDNFGANAPSILGTDFVRNNRQLLDRINTWLASMLEQWKLDVVSQSEVFSLVLTKTSRPTVQINIADVGAGVAQVLPILVQRSINTLGTTCPLEIVEQPELHLHPGAHASLAELYAEHLTDSGTKFLIETHSETFVLRLRRKIAERTLAPGDVRMYWIDDDLSGSANLKPINIDINGDVDFWPVGVFSEDYEEAKAIRKAQRESEP